MKKRSPLNTRAMASKWNMLLQEMENVCSQQDQSSLQHDDLEGKSQEDQMEMRIRLVKLKTPVGLLNSKLDTVSNQIGELEEQMWEIL